MHVLLILSPVTNLILTSSFVVGFYSSTLSSFSVSIKGWKGNFSFKSQKLVFKEKNTNRVSSSRVGGLGGDPPTTPKIGLSPPHVSLPHYFDPKMSIL